MTISLLAIYSQPPDESAFLKHYHEVHLPLVMKIPGLGSAKTNRVERNLLGGPLPYFLITEMRFPDFGTFDAAMASAENRAAGKDLANFAQGFVTLLVARDTSEG